MSNVVELIVNHHDCGSKGCERPARMAISTTRPNRGSIFSRVFFDDRTAPASARPYCHVHGVETIVQLCAILLDVDDDIDDTGTKSTEQSDLDPTRIQQALSQVITSLDYDLWKGIETPEDGGDSEWPELVSQFAEAYRGEPS